MDLLRNPGTVQRIVDDVTVQEPPTNAEINFGNVNVPPREFAFARSLAISGQTMQNYEFDPRV
jgi:hypothetical protein